MITVDIHDMPPQMQPFFAKILAGESITLCDGNQPMIEMKPLVAPVLQSAKGNRTLGNPPCGARFSDDAFDPLPEDMWNVFNDHDDKRGL